MRDQARFYGRDGLNVETYDARAERNVAASTVAGDLGFYLALARETGGPVLELGAGTGRVAWPLAVDGHEVVALELSPAMLRAAEAKRAGHSEQACRRIRFVAGDMAGFDLGPERFALAVAAFRAWQCLLSPEAQRNSLDCVRRHLRPGGRLVVDLFDPRIEWCVAGVAGPPMTSRETVTHPVTGNDVRTAVLCRENDPFRQVLREVWRFTEVDGRESVLREEDELLELRWTYRHEMRYLLELAGFEVLAETSDFRGSPPRYGGEQVWLARRA